MAIVHDGLGTLTTLLSTLWSKTAAFAAKRGAGFFLRPLGLEGATTTVTRR